MEADLQDTIDRNYEWLLEYNSGDDQEKLTAGDTLLIDNEMWRAEMFTGTMTDGTTIYMATADTRQEFAFTATDDYSGTRLSSDFLLEGNFWHKVPDGDEIHHNQQQGVIFRTSGGAETTHRFPSDTHMLFFSCVIPRETVYSMLDGEIPPCFEPYFDDSNIASSCKRFALSPALNHVVLAALEGGLTGQLWHLFMEGLLMQLTALQIAAIEKSERAPAFLLEAEPDARLRGQLLAAREYLIENLGDPPTLGELAQRVDLSEKKLNTGFKTLFGATVFETLRNERLEHARLVLERENVVLKQVAHKVGYRHVTNFINAFTRKFGKPPRQYLESDEE